MKKTIRKTLNFRGKQVKRTVFNHNLEEVVKLNNVWFKVNGENVSEDYIKFDKELYILGYPARIDLFRLGLSE